MVAVTGANGLLGAEIVKRLLSEHISTVALKRKNSNTQFANELSSGIQWMEADVLDIHSLNDCFKGVSTVIHTAAIVSFNPREEKKMFQVNVEGTKNVVNACLSNGVKNFIHVSSVAALGRQKGNAAKANIAIDEDNKWVESPLNSSYAKSKYLAELEVFRGIEEGLKAVMVNPSLILATGNWDKSSSQLFKYIWRENPFYTDGQCNYVDVRDVAQAIFQLLYTDFCGERFIISAGAIKYKQLFDQIAHRLKKKSPSLRITPRLLNLFAILEETRCKLLRTQPLITRESVKSTRENFTFSNQKSIKKLSLQYHSLQTTLDFCCEYYLGAYSTKK
jgi:dihydroflavonol-4-reductase